MPAYTVRQECDERTGEHRETEAGEDRDPLQQIQIRYSEETAVVDPDGFCVTGVEKVGFMTLAAMGFFRPAI